MAGCSPTFGWRFSGLRLLCRFYTATEILAALNNLHLNGHVHGDLKPNNVLVQYTSDSFFSVRVGDLGFSMQVGEVMYGPHGTAHYEAPEHVLNDGDVRSIPAHACMDTWSFGILLAETLIGFPLTTKVKGHRTLRRIHRQRGFYERVVHKYLSRVSGVSPKWLEVVRWCLEYNPAMRPTAGELLRYFVQHEDWELERKGVFATPVMQEEPDSAVLPDLVRSLLVYCRHLDVQLLAHCPDLSVITLCNPIP